MSKTFLNLKIVSTLISLTLFILAFTTNSFSDEKKDVTISELLDNNFSITEKYLVNNNRNENKALEILFILEKKGLYLKGDDQVFNKQKDKLYICLVTINNTKCRKP